MRSLASSPPHTSLHGVVQEEDTEPSSGSTGSMGSMGAGHSDSLEWEEKKALALRAAGMLVDAERQILQQYIYALDQL